MRLAGGGLCHHSAAALARRRGNSMTSVSRDVVRAVLETRDHRHNETHAVLVALFQGLAAELVEQGAIKPDLLASRLALTENQVADAPHGDIARSILGHVIDWLHSLDAALPTPHPQRWQAPMTGSSTE